VSVYTSVDARDDIVAKIKQLWAASDFQDVGMYGGNGPKPDLDKVPKFANFEIVFRDAEQVTLGNDPVDRTYGSIEFQFGAREGTGVRSLLAMQAYMKTGLKAATLGCVKTLIPSPAPGSSGNGWVFEALFVPFYFDSSPVAFVVP